MENIEKIQMIVLEGVDRSGKTTVVNNLFKKYTERGYMVHTIWSEVPEIISLYDEKQYNESKLERQNFVKEIDPHTLYDVISVGHLEMMYYLVKSLVRIQIETGKKQLLIADRLFLSRYVFGNYFRKWQFERIWGLKSEKYFKYAKSLEYSMRKFANTHTFIMLKNELTYDDWSIDSDGAKYELDIQQQKELNQQWKSFVFNHSFPKILQPHIITLKNAKDETSSKVEQILENKIQ